MQQENMTVVAQRKLAPLIYEMTLTGKLVDEMQRPGQFLHLKVPRQDLLLRRPISLAAVDQKQQTCKIIYRVEGEGTTYFSEMQPNDTIDVLGPLGNGFDLSFIQPKDTIFVIGGGIGVPPLYELSKQLVAKQANVIHFLGFTDKSVMYYQEEFSKLGEVHVSTDDGSFGLHGHVGMLLEAYLKENATEPAAIYSCGANGLLKAVDQKFRDHPHAYLSLEARMACGMGACYACVCHLQDDTTGTQSRKVCDEGPIFKTGEVIL